MYTTTNYNDLDREFDWDTFFSLETEESIFGKINSIAVLHDIKKNFIENSYQMPFVLYAMLEDLFLNIEFQKPRILELGAGTGFFTRLLVDRFDGTGGIGRQLSISLPALSRIFSHV